MTTHHFSQQQQLAAASSPPKTKVLPTQVGLVGPCTFRLRGVYRHVWHDIRVLKHENYDPWATF